MDINELSGEQIASALTNMIESFDKEREKSESYKDMFRAAKSNTGLLRKLEHECIHHVLDAYSILKKEEGNKTSEELYQFLLLLPYVSYKLRKHIDKTEGSCCHVDKTFFLLDKKLKELLSGQE